MQTIPSTDPAAPVELLGCVAVIGYGNQGRAHALNLRDSGVTVIIGQRAGDSFDRAVADGFAPRPVAAAAGSADLAILALPDESMGDVFSAELAARLRPGAAIGFIHGFAVRFGLIKPPAGLDVVMVAPKGPGRLVRDRFAAGGGVPALVAVHQDATGRALRRAVAWARGIGAARARLIETTFAAECESDLFGEQAVLCGGVVELMKAGFETLVAAGYEPELAYVECIHEVKQIVDLIYTEGLAGMRARISGTARFGGLTRGPRLVSEAVRAEMRRMLAEIRDGRFAAEWLGECAAGRGQLERLARAEADSGAEAAGRVVRGWSG
ncbi:MAG: ketol-acid reductoisomerase [Phycisphaerae bacterium]